MARPLEAGSSEEGSVSLHRIWLQAQRDVPFIPRADQQTDSPVTIVGFRVAGRGALLQPTLAVCVVWYHWSGGQTCKKLWQFW